MRIKYKIKQNSWIPFKTYLLDKLNNDRDAYLFAGFDKDGSVKLVGWNQDNTKSARILSDSRWGKNRFQELEYGLKNYSYFPKER